MTTIKQTTVMDGGWVTLPLVYNDNTETSTLFEIPLGAVIDPRETFLIVDTVDATETINVGIGMGTETGFDADGFIAAFSIATAGRFCVANMYTCTDGTSMNYISSLYIGVLFFGGLAGADAAEQAGIFALKNHVGDGVAKTICYTCSAGSDTFAGRLVFKMHQLPL